MWSVEHNCHFVLIMCFQMIIIMFSSQKLWVRSRPASSFKANQGSKLVKHDTSSLVANQTSITAVRKQYYAGFEAAYKQPRRGVKAAQLSSKTFQNKSRIPQHNLEAVPNNARGRLTEAAKQPPGSYEAADNKHRTFVFNHSWMYIKNQLNENLKCDTTALSNYTDPHAHRFERTHWSTHDRTMSTNW